VLSAASPGWPAAVSEVFALLRRNFKQRPQLVLAAALFVLSLVLRLWLVSAYSPIPYSDTYGSYFRLAAALRSSGLDAYDGTRVPGYPLFIALLGGREFTIWIVQFGMGVLITQMLFWMSWVSSRQLWPSFILGLLYNLIPGQFLFESNLISETLTTFLIIGSFLLLVLVFRAQDAKLRYLGLFLLGLVSSLPGMVRPLFFPLSVWFLVIVFVEGSLSWRQRLVRGALFSLAPLLIQGGWIWTMYSSYGMVAPTTMGGYSLVQHTGAFFELLPEDSLGIRDTYLEYRDVQIRERGVQTNTIWNAIPAISDVSGLNFFDLAREMRRMSLRLIAEHPGLYLQSVIQGWLTFWKAPVYWDAVMLPVYARGVMTFAALAGRLLSIGANFGFLLLSAGAILRREVRRAIFSGPGLTAAFGLIWLTSVIQTLVDHGDNPRFLMPLQMLVFFVVIHAGRFLLARGQAEGRL